MADLPWIIGGGIVLAWAVLRILGAERDRRVRELHHKIHAARPPEPPPPPKFHVVGSQLKRPVHSKVPR